MLECLVSELMIKPKGQPIFSEQATTIRLADESAGNFIEIVQQRANHERQGEHVIQLTLEEWREIRPAIERMLNLAQEQDRLVYPTAAQKCWKCKERDAAPDTGTCARCEDHDYFDVADSEIGGTD